MISIIITAYKEERTIGKAIEAIIQNNLPEYEILVVAPDRRTLNVAKSYSKKFRQVKLIKTGPKDKDYDDGKPSALNVAFKKARGDILFLTDGDVYISKNAIPLMLEKFKPGIGAVTGRPVSIDDKRKMLGYWGHLLSCVAHKRREIGLKFKKRIFCSGYLFAFRKGIFDEIPKEFISEDGYMSHLVYEAGYKIDYSPKSEVYIKYPSTFKDWITQKKRSVGGYNQIKMAIGKEIRSFKKESLGVIDVLKYPQTIRDYFYTFLLILARIYLWFVIFIDVNIKKKELKKIWLRVESTK